MPKSAPEEKFLKLRICQMCRIKRPPGQVGMGKKQYRWGWVDLEDEIAIFGKVLGEITAS
jgi:hypothetical protein